MININPNHNKVLQKKCKPLYHYVRYVARIKRNKKKGLQPKEAISEAVDWAIKKKLLNGFFKLQKEEVLAMSLTEFNAEEVTQEFIEEGREQKALEDAENLLKLNKLTEEEIAQTIGIPLEQVLKLKNKIPVLM